ncbi:MAG: 7-cyano-7-deazaguanine synthase, partial [Desulfobacula sp.]|nr:7-cyano-7-deazaguanine synthase [Desulfobacula sp.]
MTNKAVVLSSGGIDSTTAMAIAKSRGKKIYALSFKYGQRHFIELEAAKKVARSFGVKTHKIINIDLRQFGGSALTDEINVPKHDSVNEIDEEGIPITYVPARNTIFLSYAMAWAEVLKATSIYIGVTAVDYSGYPDCRPAFIE